MNIRPKRPHLRPCLAYHSIADDVLTIHFRPRDFLVALDLAFDGGDTANAGIRPQCSVYCLTICHEPSGCWQAVP